MHVPIWNRSPEKCGDLKSEFGDLGHCDGHTKRVQDCGIYAVNTGCNARGIYSKEGDGVLAGLSSKNHVVECGTYEGADMIWALVFHFRAMPGRHMTSTRATLASHVAGLQRRRFYL